MCVSDIDIATVSTIFRIEYGTVSTECYILLVVLFRIIRIHIKILGSRRGRMVVGFTTTYAISAYIYIAKILLKAALSTINLTLIINILKVFKT